MGARTKTRIALLLPGGLAPIDREVHTPSLYNLISGLSENFEIIAYSLVALGTDERPTMCGKALVKFIGAEHQASMFTKTLAFLQAFARDHKKDPFDIVHGMLGLPSEIAAILAGKYYRIRTIVSFLGGECASLPEIGYGNMRSFPLRVLTRWVANQADVLILLTQFQYTALIRYGIVRKNVHIIPFGANLASFRFTDREDFKPPIRFVHVAGLTPVKDQKTLLYSFKLISDQVDSRLEIVGPDYLDAEIQRYSLELGLANKVSFRSYVPHLNIPHFLRNSDIMLHTSLHESQGVVAVEAASMGVLLAGTAVGLMADLSDHAAITVHTKSPKALSCAILETLGNPQKINRLRNNAYLWSRQHDFYWTVANMRSIYLDSIQ
jgi:glycosyltransferase involved in cell wall biosynthesis